jgi:hypothetical protein
LHQEYRVLAVEGRYVPYYTLADGSSTPLSTVGLVGYTHVSGSTVPSTLEELAQNATWKVWHTHKPVAIKWNMRGTEEAQWTKTSVDSDHGSLVGKCVFADASQNYGRWFVTFLVELRGRK